MSGELPRNMPLHDLSYCTRSRCGNVPTCLVVCPLSRGCYPKGNPRLDVLWNRPPANDSGLGSPPRIDMFSCLRWMFLRITRQPRPLVRLDGRSDAPVCFHVPWTYVGGHSSQKACVGTRGRVQGVFECCGCLKRARPGIRSSSPPHRRGMERKPRCTAAGRNGDQTISTMGA